MTTVSIWNKSGDFEFSRNGWRRVQAAAKAGGWEPMGVITCDDISPEPTRYQDYICEMVGGNIDPADSRAMSDGLERYMVEKLSMSDSGWDDLSDNEQEYIRSEIVPFLRSDGFSVIA